MKYILETKKSDSVAFKFCTKIYEKGRFSKGFYVDCGLGQTEEESYNDAIATLERKKEAEKSGILSSKIVEF